MRQIKRLVLRFEKELKSLRKEKRKADDDAAEATAAQGEFERLSGEAEAQRDALFKEARDRDTAIASLSLEKQSRPKFNPRFAAARSREPELFASAVEISRAPPAEEDKALDAKFAAVTGPKGPVHEFINFNLSARTVDKKFFSNAALAREWAEYAQRNPKVVASPPWLLEKKRPDILKTLFESKKVPSEFKLQLLKNAGFI
jgi:hypothetical protein